MRFVYEKIDVSHKSSFITRRYRMNPESNKIHSHKNFELNYILIGSGRRIVGNHISSYTKGDLVLLGPNISHCWEVIEPGTSGYGECIVTHFRENIINSHFLNIPELSEIVNMLGEADSGILFKGAKARKVAESLRKMVYMKGLERYIELLKVFSQLLQIEDIEFLALPSSMPITYNKDREKIDKIYEYVFQNLQSNINLNDAAKLVYLEPGSFCRYFKKKTSQTFMEYVKSVRIGIAARLLVESDKQISQVCYECGYFNLANFNHHFKAIIKKTPTEYRKLFQH